MDTGVVGIVVVRTFIFVILLVEAELVHKLLGAIYCSANVSA